LHIRNARTLPFNLQPRDGSLQICTQHTLVGRVERERKKVGGGREGGGKGEREGNGKRKNEKE
jgi:hypothetical protein